MPEVIFSFDERNFHNCQERFRGERNQDYYCGDYEIESASELRVEAQKQAAGPFSINRLRSNTKLSFRRNWRHIRKDGADLVILWFVKSGQIALNWSQGRRVVDRGECLFTRSANPFHIECLLGEDALHETLHVVLPGHVLDRFRPDCVRTGLTLPAKSGEAFIADQIFSALFATPTQVSSEAAEQLVMDALSMIAGRLALATDSPPARQSLGQRRLAEIRSFVDMHLANPLMSADMVAKGCGISPRYLSLLLKTHGTSFSRLLWDKRLEKAGAWLAAAGADDLPIGEVAHRLGFKSAAHFSRMFKQTFGRTPREFRREALSRSPDPTIEPAVMADEAQPWRKMLAVN